MRIHIKRDDLSDGLVVQLLLEHLAEMHKYSPVESIHALDEDRLKDPGITFWSAWIDGTLTGCGALKQMSVEHGEIKSMKTADPFLRRGVASAILEKILKEASARKYKRLSLETGTNVAFEPSVLLYQRYGFVECGHFGSYSEDPYSRFYTREL